MAANVYYSVSPFGTGDIKTGSPTITISSGVATLSVGQTGNIGQGCRITYNTSSVCYISGVTDSTHFSVVTATGGTPGNVSGQTVNSIAHEYASLSAAEAGFTDSSHINNSSLVTADVIVNLVCYYDHDDYTADTASCGLWGPTADETRYINIYTPTGGSQSINSQRHLGKWSDTTAYRMINTGSYCIDSYDVDYTKITGLLMRSNGGTFLVESGTVSNTTGACIIQSTSANGYNLTINCSGTSYLINTIITGGGVSGNQWGLRLDGGTLRCYNTVLSNSYAGYVRLGGTLYTTNCIAFNIGSTDEWYNCTASYCAGDVSTGAGTNWVNISPGATEADDWADAFTDYANGDFSVKDASSVLYGAGIIQTGVTTDIIGTSRGSVGNACDIGAFEYVESSPALAFPPLFARRQNTLLRR